MFLNFQQRKLMPIRLPALDRRLYELCRKYCGEQHLWSISLKKLYQKIVAGTSCGRSQANCLSMLAILPLLTLCCISPLPPPARPASREASRRPQ